MSIIRDAIKGLTLPIILVLEPTPTCQLSTLEQLVRNYGLTTRRTSTNVRVLVITRTDKGKVRGIEGLPVQKAFVAPGAFFVLEETTPDVRQPTTLALGKQPVAFAHLLLSMGVVMGKSLLVSAWQLQENVPPKLRGVKFCRRGEKEWTVAAGAFVLLDIGDQIGLADQIDGITWRTYRFMMI